MVMVIVFLICWSPYASLALATILGYAQVLLISKMHAFLRSVLFFSCNAKDPHENAKQVLQSKH